MNITQEKIDSLNALIKVNIKPEDYTERVEKAIKAQAKKANIPGFRPGMVPPAHIKRMYGKSILLDEINNLLSDTLNNYITESKLEILGQPLPKEEDEKDYKWDFKEEYDFTYEVGLAPEFELDFSAADKLTQYTIKVDAETLESRIKNLRKSYGKMSNPEVAEAEDILFSELTELNEDSTVKEGGLVKTGSVRIDFVKDEEIKKSLVGLKKGDSLTIDLNKAFDGDKDLIGRILSVSAEELEAAGSLFNLEVKNVNRLDEADLDQEFFDKLFGADQVKSEEEFKAKIVDELEGMMVQNADQKLHNEIIDHSLGKYSLTLPDEFLKRWLKATNPKLSETELAEGYDDFARNLKWTLIENKIMKANSIEIKYEEVLDAAKQRLDAQFRMYSPQALSDDQLNQYAVQFLQNKENANRIFEEVKTLKVLEYLKTVITLDKNDIEYNKFLELK